MIPKVICLSSGTCRFSPKAIGLAKPPSTISDSIYGSTFFLATGFHGFHVIIGTLFSIICGIRQYLGHLTKEHHVGFEAAAWYWHFVDVVWVFLLPLLYLIGSRAT